LASNDVFATHNLSLSSKEFTKSESAEYGGEINNYAFSFDPPTGAP
jgi:hypothetical protein